MLHNTVRLKRDDAERIHAAWMRLGWTQTKMHNETGIDRAILSRFYHRKAISAVTAGRLALAIAGGLSGGPDAATEV